MNEKENEFVAASEDYVRTNKLDFDKTLSIELRKAFLAGVQYGLNKADEIHKSTWDEDQN
jgi:hypothetical protein